MEKPYNHIEKVKKSVKSLLCVLNKSDKKSIEDLNNIIDLINSYENLLKEKYYTDFFDLIILSRMYHTFLKSNEDEINVREFIVNFDQDLRLGREFYYESINSLLNTKQINTLIKKDCLNKYKPVDWSIYVNSLLKQVKKRIIWKKHGKN